MFFNKNHFTERSVPSGGNKINSTFFDKCSAVIVPQVCWTVASEKTLKRVNKEPDLQAF
jgi:hypothetical protein